MTKLWYNLNSKPEFILLFCFPHLRLFSPTVNHLASIILNIFTYWLPLPVSSQLPITFTKSSHLSTWPLFVQDLTRHTGLPCCHPHRYPFLLSWAQIPFANLLLLLSLPDGCPSTPHRLIHPPQAATSCMHLSSSHSNLDTWRKIACYPTPTPYTHGCLLHLGLPNDLY